MSIEIGYIGEIRSIWLIKNINKIRAYMICEEIK